MATKEEMDAFYADQRNVYFHSFASAAVCALGVYDLDDVNRQRLMDVIRAGQNIRGMNWMFNDKQGRMLWIRGDIDAKKSITLTYRASQWIN